MNRVVVTANGAASALQLSGIESLLHPTSIVDPSVVLGERIAIHANVIIERGVRIGSGTVIHAGCYIGEDCVIGEETVLHPAVVLREKTQIGSRVLIQSGVVIGSDGFGYAKEPNGMHCKIPQVGFVIIEDDVRIGANAAIDRATLGRTTIGKGAVIGSLVQVGHNVSIGQDSLIGNGVGICGSSKIGASVKIGHGVGMVGHIRIGDGASVMNGSGISKDVADGAVIGGSPAMDAESFRYYQENIAKLPEYIERLAALEKKLKK